MPYLFPDAERGLMDILDAAGETTTFEMTDARLDNLPAHEIYSVGGTETGPLRYDRISIATYATGRTSAKEAAERAKALIMRKGQMTSTGLIDSVRVESEPVPVKYSDEVNRFIATYRVDTRAISRLNVT
jgi:hypothetical protein